MSNVGAYFTILCVLCMQSLGMRGQVDSSDPAKVAEEITRLEQDRSKAQVQGDVSKLNELLAPEFMEMNVAGQIRTKAENIQAHTSGQIHWQAFDISDTKVQVYGNTAIVTGRLSRKGTLAGRNLSGRSRYTRYYLKKQGHWQAIFQYSLPETQ
ncbi:MAG TPA: nuclear transport factor 2 family protein [Terriglobales bacterium]|nr:nuclear transport factor 2 family protein [Terriglobales bacterium]